MYSEQFLSMIEVDCTKVVVRTDTRSNLDSSNCYLNNKIVRVHHRIEKINFKPCITILEATSATFVLHVVPNTKDCKLEADDRQQAHLEVDKGSVAIQQELEVPLPIP